MLTFYRLTFHRKSAPKPCIRQITGIFSGLFTVNLKTYDHSNLKLLMICRHTTSFKIQILKFRILEILHFHP